MDGDLTLVLDIGKSHAKLLMIDAAGAVVERHGRDNRSVMSALGYPALDVAGLTRWVAGTLRGLEATRRCRLAIASTHGAAFVALGGRAASYSAATAAGITANDADADGDTDAGAATASVTANGPSDDPRPPGGGHAPLPLAWDPIDYEFDGVASTRAAYAADVAALGGQDDFDATLAPDLPAGLNAARQLHWLQRTHPDAWARTATLLPYPQFWAWWLCGVAASELSSLGCHTQLWHPHAQDYSALARRQGWAERFAPRRAAWDRLGPVTPTRAADTGLPPDCQVVCGVHDSNACLARYLHDAAAMTLVSTGTWVVAMAPGAATGTLDPARDLLGNVSVRGEVVPTGRFMGGRELAALCAGASPALARIDVLDSLLDRGVTALPSFAAQGGPFVGCSGQVLRQGRPIDPATALPPAERASLAAWYAAQVTAWLLDRLGAAMPVVLEGPFADNPVFAQALAALLPPGALQVSTDTLEGTARGAWMLARWEALAPAAPSLRAVAAPDTADRLREHHAAWRRAVDGAADPAAEAAVRR